MRAAGMKGIGMTRAGHEPGGMKCTGMTRVGDECAGMKRTGVTRVGDECAGTKPIGLTRVGDGPAGITRVGVKGGGGGPDRARRERPGPGNRGRTCRRGLRALPFLLLLLGPGLLLANGGTLRVANAEVGPWWVSVFTDPTPVRADTLDVSILITRIGGLEVVPGLDVTVRAEPLGDEGEARSLPATREAADDPRYYAAKFSLGHIGRWRITVDVQGEDGGGETSFEVEARELRLLDRPLVLIFVSILPLLLAAWWFLRGAPEEGTRGRPQRVDDEGGNGRVQERADP